MLKINQLIEQLASDYPTIQFQPAKTFQWAVPERTIFYHTKTKNSVPMLLHELAHALLDHQDTHLDIELVKKERLAWRYAAQHLAPKYRTTITDTVIEDAMDTYRDWLHRKSTCPDCRANGLQNKDGTYKCLACGCLWRANDARTAQLKRYRVKTALT